MLINNMTTLAEIVRISNINSLRTTIRKINSETLVIFDVDHVLMMPTDEYSLNRNTYRKQLWQDIAKRYSAEEAKILRSIAVRSIKWRLVDPDIINILSYLKSENVPTIALTSYVTGKFGVIEKMEDLRIKELKSVGINFAHLAPFHGKFLVNELKDIYGTPMLKDGVILTAEIDKGKVLEYIFHSKNYYPKAVVFVDDKLDNLESLEKLCVKLKIQFQGFHYTAVSSMPVAVDKQVEKLRFQILEKEHRWLSYKELYHRINDSYQVNLLNNDFPNVFLLEG